HPGIYPISNNYEIETFWKRNEKNHIQASINYVDKTPHYIIEWTYHKQNYIIQYLKRKTALSGILIFEIQLYKELTKNIPKTNHLKYIKPLSEISNRAHRNRTKRAAENLFNEFENKKNKIWHSKDNPKLKEILEKKQAQKIIQTMDQSKILRNGYRVLTATSRDLSKELLISKERHNIDKIIQKHILILVYSMKTHTQKEIAITLEKSGYHNISSILKFLIPKLVENKVLNYEAPTICLRISCDRKNVEKKIKQVMLILAILNDQKNLSKPESHYSISLFSEAEKYTSLKAALDPIHHELQELCKNSFINNNY
ncbi:7349_t:CDS:2, partial [Scutellospora calospora]